VLVTAGFGKKMGEIDRRDGSVLPTGVQIFHTSSRGCWFVLKMLWMADDKGKNEDYDART